MTATDTTARARQVIDAFNRGDWQQFRQVLADNVVYQETGTGRRVEGVDAYVELCQGWKQAFPDVTGAIQNTATSGNMVAQEVLWEGT